MIDRSVMALVLLAGIFCLAKVTLAGTYAWVTTGSTNNSRNLAMSADGKNQSYEVYSGSKWLVNYASNLYTSRTASSTLTQSFNPSFFTKGNPSDIWIAFWGTKFGYTGLYNFKFGDTTPATAVGLPAANTFYPVVKTDGTVIAYRQSTNDVYLNATLIAKQAASSLATDGNGAYIAFKGTDGAVYVYSSTNTTAPLYTKTVTGGTATDKPAISADGRYLAIQTATDMITLFNLNDGTQVRTFAGNAPVAISADGSLLVCTSLSTDVPAKKDTNLYKTDGTKVRSVADSSATELAVSTTGPRIGMVSSAVLAGNTGTHSDIFTWDYTPPTISSTKYDYAATSDTLTTDITINITNPDSSPDALLLTAAKKDGTLDLPVVISATGTSRTMSITNGATPGNETITVTATDGITTLTKDYTIAINSGVAAKLAFLSAPMIQNTGVATDTIIVQQQDIAGNPVTSVLPRTVVLSTSSPTGVFAPVSPITIAAGASTATFTYTDTTVGTHTIIAASTAPTTITSASQEVRIIDPDTTIITGIRTSSGTFGLNISGENAGELCGVVIRGMNFKPGTAIELHRPGQPAITGSFTTVNSSTSITCNFSLSGNSIGNWDLYAVNNAIESTLPAAVTLTPAIPKVEWITPTTVMRGQIMKGNILGYGFINGASITLKKAGQAGIPLPQSYITYWGNNRLTVAGLIPGGTPAGDYQVIVTNQDLQYSVDNVTLKIVAGTPPTITSVSPVNQQNDQAACPLTINGTGFSGTPTVKLGSTITATDVVVVSSTQLTCTANIDGVNTACYDITVTNPDSGTTTLQHAFTVVSPILTSVSLTADPVAPRAVGSTIKISAISTSNAAYGIDYEYHVRYYNTAMQIWVDNTLAGFTPDTDYLWTPTEALNYYLYVIAKVRGTGTQVMSAELNYPITVPTLTSIYMQFTTKSANTVELKALKYGTATNVEYYFYGYKKIGTEWTSFTIRTYDGMPGNDTVLWTVPAPDAYRFVVLARIIGSTSAYQVASPVFYRSY